MLDIHYFAGYRERLGLSREQLPFDAQLSTLAALRAHLLARGGVWQALAADNLMCARNQELCGLDQELADGDEIAFFPPVTGG